jgi:hypothetical protein
MRFVTAVELGEETVTALCARFWVLAQGRARRRPGRSAIVALEPGPHLDRPPSRMRPAHRHTALGDRPHSPLADAPAVPASVR